MKFNQNHSRRRPSGPAMTFAAMALTAMLLACIANAQEKPPASTADLALQVDALTHFDDLDLTDKQLTALLAMANDTAGKVVPAAGNAKPPAAYVEALTQLRQAYLKKDQAAIDTAQDKLDDLQDKDNTLVPPDIETSAAAIAKGPDALKLLTTGQVVNYLAQHSDEVPSPAETILDAMDLSRGMPAADYTALKKECAEQVATLVVGLDDPKAKELEDKVNALLDKYHAMKDAEYTASEAKRDADAHDLTAEADPIQGIQYWMEGEMADLLANPQLKAAIAARLK